MISTEIHALCEIATVIHSLKRCQIIVGGSASSYVAYATLTVNRKGAGTFGQDGALICARLIAWLRYVVAADTPVSRTSTEARSYALTAPGPGEYTRQGLAA
jgi:hypothetical protein